MIDINLSEVEGPPKILRTEAVTIRWKLVEFLIRKRTSSGTMTTELEVWLQLEFWAAGTFGM